MAFKWTYSIPSSRWRFLDKLNIKEKVLAYYNVWGYYRTIEYIKELSKHCSVSLMERSKLQTMITELELIPKRRKRKK